MPSFYLILPEIVLLLVFSLALGLMTILFHGHFTFLQGTFVLPLGALAAFAVLASLPRWKKHLSRFLPDTRLKFILRDWAPLILLAFVYENLHEYTSLLSGNTVDAALRALDTRIFSVDLPLWIERFNSRWFTEYMTFTYALYFFFPTYLLVRVYAQGRTYAFRQICLAISMCFYLSFVGYILVPAVGPRYFMAHEFRTALEGYWLTPVAADVWNTFEKVKTDCFPSQHTALSMISLIYFWRCRKMYAEGRIVFFAFLPLIVSLWFSTLYLRYHWAVDVMAGSLLAFFCVGAAQVFGRWYFKKTLGVDIDQSPIAPSELTVKDVA